MWFSNVVFPAPRKPVRTVTGIVRVADFIGRSLRFRNGARNAFLNSRHHRPGTLIASHRCDWDKTTRTPISDKQNSNFGQSCQTLRQAYFVGNSIAQLVGTSILEEPPGAFEAY